MQHISCKTASLAVILAFALVGSVQAQQQHQQHHPGGAQAPQQQPPETGQDASAQPQTMEQMQGMMQHMQGMMQHMQGMMGVGGMGMTTQEEEAEEDEEPSRGGMRGRRGMMGSGGMMGPGGMMQHHLERLAQQLALTDTQQTQVRTLLSNHAKDAVRLNADIAVMAIDVQQLLGADAVDLPKVKQLLQDMATKEADLRFAQVTLIQEIHKLLTPEQQQKFRAMRDRMMGHGMRGMRGRGMMGRGHRAP